MKGSNGSLEWVNEFLGAEIYATQGKWISYRGINGDEVGLLVESDYGYGVLTLNGDMDRPDAMIHIYRKSDAVFNKGVFAANKDEQGRRIGPFRRTGGNVDTFQPHLDVLVRALEETGWTKEGAKINAQLKPIEVKPT